MKHHHHQWNQKTLFTRFTWNVYWKFLKISVWLLALNNSNLSTEFNKLGIRIENLVKLSGFTFTVSYLKESLRLCQKAIAGEPTVSHSEPRVASRRGLPLIIPGSLRLLIEARDPRVTKGVLTILSVFRVMPAQPKLKLETITSPFTGLYKTTPEIIPVVDGLKRRFKIPSYFKADTSPFHRGARMLTLTTAGPNLKNQLVGYPIDSLAWSRNPSLLKVFSSFLIRTNNQDLLRKLNMEIATWCSDKSRELLKKLRPWEEASLKLGKLSLKQEPAGKVRVFAIVDAWTQSALYPLHEGLFDIIRQFPSDGTFDQMKPLKALMAKGFKNLYSFDLSAATDRLPIDLQTDVLSHLFDDPQIALDWRDLLIKRDYHLFSTQFGQNDNYRYEVGQPMGALSSWGMLALTHHLLVQVAARRSGFNTWFNDYALLGDDIVIANQTVANSYQALMTDLGVEINLSKSLTSSIGVCEFAKKLMTPWGDLSPFGPKSLWQFINSPTTFSEIFINNDLFHIEEVDEIVDGAALVIQLKKLFKSAESFSSQKWMRKLQSTYWDLVSWFGLNLVQDLSPSLMAQAVDSLDTRDLEQYNSILDEVLLSKVTRGWIKGWTSDAEMYRRYRRFLSIDSPYAHFPSTQSVLTALSVIMTESASHHLHDFEDRELVERIKLAYTNFARLTWTFDEQPKPRRDSKALKLSRDLLLRLGSVSPTLLIKVVSNSQAVSEFDNSEVSKAKS